MQFVISEEQHGVRLDSYLGAAICSVLEQQGVSKNFSRSHIQKIVRAGGISCAGKVLKPSSKMKKDQIIDIAFSEDYTVTKPTTNTRMEILPEKIPLDILFEDEDLLVINKPKGMAVHSAPESETRASGTLVNALLYHCMDEKGMVHLATDPTQYFRPGIVHRIDRQTSGVLVVAKNPESHMGLKEQFQDHSITRKYLCLCHGVPSKSNGRIHSIIGRHPTIRTRQAVLQDISEYPEEQLESIAEEATAGKLARSAWIKRISFTLPNAPVRMVSLQHQVSLVEFELFTGRTHQIRAQMQKFSHPLLFDPLYRTSTRKKSQLHLPIKPTSQEEYLMEKLNPKALGLYQTEDDIVAGDPVKQIGQCLHASSLSFFHPIQGIPLHFEAPIPVYFHKIINLLKKLPGK